MTVMKKQSWSKPQLICYGNVEDITEQQPVGTVTKSGGSGDTITVTIAGVTCVVASGAAAGSSLINIKRH
jgi:hypothetical protein